MSNAEIAWYCFLGGVIVFFLIVWAVFQYRLWKIRDDLLLADLYGPSAVQRYYARRG